MLASCPPPVRAPGTGGGHNSVLTSASRQMTQHQQLIKQQMQDLHEATSPGSRRRRRCPRRGASRRRTLSSHSLLTKLTGQPERSTFSGARTPAHMAHGSRSMRASRQLPRRHCECCSPAPPRPRRRRAGMLRGGAADAAASTITLRAILMHQAARMGHGCISRGMRLAAMLPPLPWRAGGGSAVGARSAEFVIGRAIGPLPRASGKQRSAGFTEAPWVEGWAREATAGTQDMLASRWRSAATLWRR